MLFSEIRYLQQYQQLQNRPITGAGNIATYDTRDATTGQRIVTAADGSQYYAQYLSNSQPVGVLGLTSQSTTTLGGCACAIGLPGYASQKPH